ncbi:zinc finger MYM-type protein 1-like [Mixophyes fleayi]|uniref:zinc finger MYM-type protein 1-like n=1 Tax=Mixophyes fleayi TaxID=3061075 RepID=UPI003F4D889F
MSLSGHGLDSAIQRNLEKETEKFAALLERLLDVTLYLASRNMAFRGSSQRIGDLNNGNFLGTLELVSHYDPLLREHLENVKHSQQEGKRMQAHYLSWATQNEFINLCGKRVLDTILSEREKAIYFSVICDSTPDVSHTEQNVIVLRYVLRDSVTECWIIQERFIEYFDFFNKTGEEVAEKLLSRLNEHGIDVKDCRGQGYDNGANMSGKIKGVRARIEEKYPTATFCPCAAHSLNLVAVHAASCSSDARVEAVRPITQKLPGIIEALKKIILSRKLSSEAHSVAEGLRDYFLSFKSILLSTFWIKILQSFEERIKILQSRSISMEIGAANIKDLSVEMQAFREKWSVILSEANLIADSMEIPKDLNPRYRKIQKRHSREDLCQEVDAETSFKINVFLVALDSIISELNQRFKSMQNICNLFAPILKLKTLPEEEWVTSTEALVSKYPKGLTPSLFSELQHLRKVYDATFQSHLGPLDLLNNIYSLQLQGIFGEVCIAIRIFTTLPLSVAEGERAFSKLALIKNYLCLTMSEQHLNSLALLSIEHELAQKLNFLDLIQDFASSKVRRWSTNV